MTVMARCGIQGCYSRTHAYKSYCKDYSSISRRETALCRDELYTAVVRLTDKRCGIQQISMAVFQLVCPAWTNVVDLDNSLLELSRRSCLKMRMHGTSVLAAAEVLAGSNDVVGDCAYVVIPIGTWEVQARHVLRNAAQKRWLLGQGGKPSGVVHNCVYSALMSSWCTTLPDEVGRPDIC